mgnify:CR=1 FL=1
MQLDNGQPQYLPKEDGYTRVASLKGFWKFVPQGDGKVEVTYQVHTEPGGSVPSWLANSFVVEAPFNTLSGLRALAEEPGLRLSINMSARSIGYPAWMDTLRRGVSADPQAAERLILEITESSAMGLPDEVKAFMREVQRYGIGLALDDFGAGYTSFRYLRDFCFDMIKIDGQFIREIATHPDNQVLTQALMSIAHHFDMFTVAEMVETADDAAFLIDNGIDCLQGYYFGAPTIAPPWKSPPSVALR